MMQENNLIQLAEPKPENRPEDKPENQPEPKRKPTDLKKLAEQMKAEGVTATSYAYYNSHSKNDPQELKPASDFTLKVVNAFYPPGGIEPGTPPPWERAQKLIRFLPNDLSVWTGVNGHGKSQFLGHLALDAMHKGLKVCIASLELKPSNLLKRLTRQASAMELPTKEYIEAIQDWTNDKLWIHDITGNTNASQMLKTFAYAKQTYGIDVFIIDSLMRCGIAEDDYNAQKAFVGQLCDFKNQYNCHIHLITHPRKSLDETKIPGKMDICGSGSISNQADNCFTVWRNKKKEDELQIHSINKTEPPEELLRKPDCIWMCDKQRNGSNWEGKILLWFDQKSFQYLNYRGQKPRRYVDFSNAKNINCKEANNAK